VTKLGRLVKEKLVKRLEEVFLFSLPVKEPQIVDWFLGSKVTDDVIKIMPVQKQTKAGQRTRFKAYIVVGDKDGHIGLGAKCSKEVSGAIKGAIADAKVNLVPVRRGYWGNKVGPVHTVPCKITGKCGSVSVRLIPAARGTGIVACATVKKILVMAGVQDCYTQTQGRTKTMPNLARAAFDAVSRTYGFLDPTLWRETKVAKDLFAEHSDFLMSTSKAKKAMV